MDRRSYEDVLSLAFVFCNFTAFAFVIFFTPVVTNNFVGSEIDGFQAIVFGSEWKQVTSVPQQILTTLANFILTESPL